MLFMYFIEMQPEELAIDAIVEMATKHVDQLYVGSVLSDIAD